MLRRVKRHTAKHPVPPKQNCPVAPHLILTHPQQNVIPPQDRLRRRNRQQAVNPRPHTIIVQTQIPPIPGILQRHNPDPRHRKPIVTPVLDVLQEMINDRRRNEKSGVLQSWNPHERHPHHPVILQHRPSTVTRIDRRVRLNRQKAPVPNVHVGLQLHPRHHPRVYEICSPPAGYPIVTTVDRTVGNVRTPMAPTPQKIARRPPPTTPGRNRAQ
jgi:hypothetical protein